MGWLKVRRSVGHSFGHNFIGQIVSLPCSFRSPCVCTRGQLKLKKEMLTDMMSQVRFAIVNTFSYKHGTDEMSDMLNMFASLAQIMAMRHGLNKIDAFGLPLQKFGIVHQNMF